MHLANLEVEYADNKDNSNKDNKQRKRGTGNYVKEERPEPSIEHSDEEFGENFDRPSYGGANTYKKKRQQSHYGIYAATEEDVWNLATGEAEDMPRKYSTNAPTTTSTSNPKPKKIIKKEKVEERKSEVLDKDAIKDKVVINVGVSQININYF
jgi:hypothetical protein